VRATPLTRRGALIALAGLGAAALAACDPPRQAAVQPQPGAATLKIAAIAIDTSALSGVSGEATAGWVQSALPGQLAKAFEPYMAPGDPDGARLSVQISSVLLGMVGAAPAIDSISGAATLSGGRSATTAVTLDATTAYSASPADQTLSEPSQRRRVEALTRAFAYWLPRKFDL
jgi:hypothetical protein